MQCVPVLSLMEGMSVAICGASIGGSLSLSSGKKIHEVKRKVTAQSRLPKNPSTKKRNRTNKKCFTKGVML